MPVNKFLLAGQLQKHAVAQLAQNKNRAKKRPGNHKHRNLSVSDNWINFYKLHSFHTFFSDYCALLFFHLPERFLCLRLPGRFFSGFLFCDNCATANLALKRPSVTFGPIWLKLMAAHQNKYSELYLPHPCPLRILCTFILPSTGKISLLAFARTFFLTILILWQSCNCMLL